MHRVHRLPADEGHVDAAVGEDAGAGLDALGRAVAAHFGSAARADGSILTNARQAGAVERAARATDDAIRAMASGMTPDAVLLDVEAAMAALGEITGRHVREEITARIFERFCVGK